MSIAIGRTHTAVHLEYNFAAARQRAAGSRQDGISEWHVPACSTSDDGTTATRPPADRARPAKSIAWVKGGNS
ncbi:MAG: hypothetical protein OEX97_11025, partial [Acidimicrobiia bacterium]|nr:hypothetical protein [Acidimicrobiia bacterium]